MSSTSRPSSPSSKLDWLSSVPHVRDKPHSDRLRAVGRTPIRAEYGIERRSFLRAAMAFGTVAGLALIGLLPPARKALANGYDIKQDCNGASAKGNYDGCKACCCSTVCTPTPCGGCCTGGDCWHRNDGFNYWLRPDECVWPGGADNYDGWKWKTASGCGQCSGSTPYREWRCHDGWTRIETGGSIRTICNKKLSCHS